MKFTDCTPRNEEMINTNFANKDKASYFHISPLIVRTKENSIVRIKSDFSYISLVGEYHILINPYYDYSYVPFNLYKDHILRIHAENGELNFCYRFETEQLYKITIAEPTEDGYRLVCSAEVYALDDDLFHLKPLIGDLHCHTTYSDGFESPELVLRSAAKKHLDFLAITDHNNYQGSVAAAQIRENDQIPITVIHGEEIASPFTKMHILSLGGNKSVSETVSSTEVYKECSSEYDHICRLVDDIHATEGIAVMCHPLWKVFIRDGSRWDVPLSTVTKLLNNNIFDAVEVVSGSQHGDIMSSNIMHTIACEYGNDTAYIGVTDSHMYSTDQIAGKHITFVFAENNTEVDIVNAIREKRTTAIEIEDHNNVLCFGSLRISLFAQFFVRSIYLRKNENAGGII